MNVAAFFLVESVRCNFPYLTINHGPSNHIPFFDSFIYYRVKISLRLHTFPGQMLQTQVLVADRVKQ